jgi:hypothetical protein
MLFPWYTFCLLFLIPFVDPRRPFRAVHLDLLVLVLVGIGPLQDYLGAGHLQGSLALTVLGLGYLAARCLYLGFRPGSAREPLVPVLPAWGLAVALVLVLGLRFGYVLESHTTVSDVGLSSIAGADRIGKGQEVYDPRLDHTLWEGSDTYGPATYLAYVPFELALPWHGGFGTPDFDHKPEAGWAAAITFDILVLIGLFQLGRRIRPGPEGRVLGLALTYAWAAYPYSLLEIHFGLNNSLVAMLVLAAFLALPQRPSSVRRSSRQCSPPARGSGAPVPGSCSAPPSSASWRLCSSRCYRPVE